jgi:hypothetical protein
MPHSRYFTLAQICKLGADVLTAHDRYKQKRKTQDAEFSVDRILYGVLFERFRSASKKTTQSAVRQARVHPTRRHSGRIDFLVGGRETGTFIELAVRTQSKLGGAYASQNRDEIRKLSKVPGRARYLLLIDTTGNQLNSKNLYDSYAEVVPSRGRHRHRNSVVVVYLSSTGAGCSFTWEPDRPINDKTARLKTFELS